MSTSESAAFVGIAISNNVIYNIVHREGEFSLTGMSIVRFLNLDKNSFLSKMMESQSYNGIDVLLDDEFVFCEHIDNKNINIDTFSNIHSLMIDGDERGTDYYYIYDVYEDVLLVKTPEQSDIVALDYKNSKDIRDFTML